MQKETETEDLKICQEFPGYLIGVSSLFTVMKREIYFLTKLNFFLLSLYTLEWWSRADPECWAACFSAVGCCVGVFFPMCVHVVLEKG